MQKHTLMWLAVFCVIAWMFLQLPQRAVKQDAVLHTYSALVEVDALARQKYVEPITDDRLVEGAIRGMMFQLDPYSGYIAPRELPSFERRSRGDYIGVGMEIGFHGGRPTVIAPIEDSPAARAGILAGDTLLAIDGEDLEGLSVFELNERLGGRPGSSVRLRVLHPGRTEAEETELLRGPVSIQAVRGFRRGATGFGDYMIDPHRRIGYIRVSNFHENMMRDFDEALEQLLSEEPGGLIVDLRFNPGGLMDQAVDMVNRFVDEGTILSTVTRRRAVEVYAAKQANTLTDIPLVVLINRGSASSSEIVAGSLQDHKRAILVGERSFGKGSVQHLIRLREHRAAIKLTVAHYRLPSGRIIHRGRENERLDSWGVKPDVEVVLTDEEVRAIQDARRTIDLTFAGSPSTSGASPTGQDRGSDSGATESAPPEIIRDRQLEKALALLGE